MWYIISGKLMSGLCLTILSKSLAPISNLILFESSMGWFLFEHVFEEYHLTAGKFFLINEDFRTLVRNSVVIIRNFIFLAQALNPLEFITIYLILMFTYFFYKNKHFKDFVRIIILISYYFLFESFLVFNFYIFCILLINILPIYFLIITLWFYFYLIYLNIVFSDKRVNKLMFIKLFIYLLLIIINFFYYLKITLPLFKEWNNFVHELVLNLIIPYLYYYANFILFIF
jgi:hypothetical protein